jgi:hypothetical protein
LSDSPKWLLEIKDNIYIGVISIVVDDDMELPPWLKIEQLIGKLNLSGWFREWFKKENSVNIGTVVSVNKVIVLSLNPTEKPKSISEDKIYQKVGSEEIEFTVEEKFLISRINRAHSLCGRPGFNFETNFKQALNHIRKKPTSDWYECAAKDMVQAKEYIDLFGTFKEVEDPEKKVLFDSFKTDVDYLYGIIQGIKHGDKVRSIEEEFLTPYDKKLKNKIMTDETYEKIFKDFQDSLIKLFNKFKLRDE